MLVLKMNNYFKHLLNIEEISGGRRSRHPGPPRYGLVIIINNNIFVVCGVYTDITDETIMNLNLPTGIPFEYTLDENFKPLVSMKFLGDEETVKKAMDAIAAQGKTK
jgi:hypothetical protein